MRKVILTILIIAVAALFVIPESALQDYQGLLKAKYFLKDTAGKVKSILISLIKGERPKEFDELEKSIKDEVKDTLKESATETIEGL